MLIAFVLASVPVTVWGADSNGGRECMLEDGIESASMRQHGEGHQAERGSLSVRVIDPDTNAESVVTVACSAKSVEAISVLLAPRREAVIELVLTRHASGDARFNATVIAPDGVSSDSLADWLTLEPQTGFAMAATGATVRVILRSTPELAPGSTHELLLTFELVEDDNVSVVEIPLMVEIQGEDPMFRDRFEVDPVLGQFSYRAPRSGRSTRGVHATGSAGTGE
ncbi:MAG: hypothetical protein ACNA7J_07075 [Wenzhouxiangella sp.]